MDIHPSQYQSPLTDVSPSKQAAAVQYMNPQQDRSTGKKINQAFYLTILFLVLSNSYKFLNNVYYLWTNQSVLINEMEYPTLKGYVFMSILFFIGAFWLLKK